MAKSDRRSQYTEKLIRSVFLEMLQEMPAEKISVAEICRRADINRGTFYLHYQDCRDLLETIGAELAEEQSAHIDMLFSSEQSLKENASALLEGLSDKNRAGLIIFSNDKSKCFDLISEKAREATVNSWLERSSLSRRQAELLYTFISGGGYSTAQAVYRGEIDMQMQEIYELIFELISNGLNAFVDRL